MDCPFITHGKIECVYKIGRECEDIEVCPMNSDSYCGNAVLTRLLICGGKKIRRS